MLDIPSVGVPVSRLDVANSHGEMGHRYNVIPFAYRGDDCDIDRHLSHPPTTHPRGESITHHIIGSSA